MGRAAPTIAVRCTYCRDALERRRALFCAACLAPHHFDCHVLHGRCAAPGCDEAATVRPRMLGRRLPRMAEAPRAEPPRRGRDAAWVVAGAVVGLAAIAVGFVAGHAAGARSSARASRPPARARTAPGTNVLPAGPAPAPAESPPVTLRPPWTVNLHAPAVVMDETPGQQHASRTRSFPQISCCSAPSGPRLLIVRCGTLAFPVRVEAGERVLVDPARDGVLVVRFTQEGVVEPIAFAERDTAIDLAIRGGFEERVVPWEGPAVVRVDFPRATRRAPTPEEHEQALTLRARLTPP